MVRTDDTPQHFCIFSTFLLLFLEDHYPIKRVMVFLFSPDAKSIEKSVKYAIIELAAEQTKLNQKRQRSLDLPRL